MSHQGQAILVISCIIYVLQLRKLKCRQIDSFAQSYKVRMLGVRLISDIPPEAGIAHSSLQIQGSLVFPTAWTRQALRYHHRNDT
jgi:hypothetical protein